MSQHHRGRRAFYGKGVRIVAALLALQLALPAAAADVRRISLPQPVAAVQAMNARRLDPSMKMAQLRALPADTPIALSSGRTIRAAQLLATSEALKQVAARSASLRAMDLRMSRPSGTAQLQWSGPQQFQQMARLPANAVVRLQDGRQVSAGDIQKLQALAEATDLPRKLEARAQASATNLRGTPALVLRSAEDLRKVERLPDNAIVATEDGTRATAGDIRKVIAQPAAASKPALRMPGAK